MLIGEQHSIVYMYHSLQGEHSETPANQVPAKVQAGLDLSKGLTSSRSFLRAPLPHTFPQGVVAQVATQSEWDVGCSSLYWILAFPAHGKRRETRLAATP